MELETKLYLVDEKKEKFMGIGVLWLLENIEKSQSLRAASISMNLSYSKAFSMLKRLEENVGRPFVERKRGGARREGVTLTPFARRYMAEYREFQERAKKAAEEEFLKFEEKVGGLLSKEADDDEARI